MEGGRCFDFAGGTALDDFLKTAKLVCRIFFDVVLVLHASRKASDGAHHWQYLLISAHLDAAPMNAEVHVV